MADPASPPLRIAHVDASTWDDLEALFGRGGASNGCWCQYWLLGPAYHRRERSLNRDDLREQVESGEAGLLAYGEDRAVGWVRLTRRSNLPRLVERFSLPDEDDTWTLPCFYVASRHRGAGVMTALIDAAVAWAAENVVRLEAYPVDPSVDGATRNRFSGVLQPFLDAGFREVSRPSPERVVVARSGRRSS